MDPQEIARLRSASQRIAVNYAKSPAELVSWFGAMQAQDYPAAKWAVGLRLQLATDQSIEDAIMRKELVRTWPMRGTLHFVPPQDAHWMLELMAPRTMQKAAGRYKQLGLEPSQFTKAQRILAKAMQGNKPLIRKEALTALAEGGIDTREQRGYHILVNLAHAGLIAIAGLRGKQPEFVWFDDWFPPSKRVRLSRKEALTEMARRYVRSHGPVTVYDFAWWTGLTISECRLAFAELEPTLEQIVAKEQKEPLWMFPFDGTVADSVQLVPPFDETIVAFKDRSAIIAAEDFTKLVPYSNGIFSPAVLVNGQFVGLWQRTVSKQGVQVLITLTHKNARIHTEQMKAEAERYARFLGQPLRQCDIVLI